MKIDYTRSFKKEYKKLTPKLQRKFHERLEVFRENPFQVLLNNHATHHPYENCHSINITGDIRALYENIGDTILFVHIGTHSELYK